MAETFIGKAERQKLLQRYGLANAVNVGKMNQHPGDGKFFQPLPAGAARGNEILSVGNDDDFNDLRSPPATIAAMAPVSAQVPLG